MRNQHPFDIPQMFVRAGLLIGKQLGQHYIFGGDEPGFLPGRVKDHFLPSGKGNAAENIIRQRNEVYLGGGSRLDDVEREAAAD